MCTTKTRGHRPRVFVYSMTTCCSQTFPKIDELREARGKLFESYMVYGENNFPKRDKVDRDFWNNLHHLHVNGDSRG
jgi:hypothetical protein